MRSSPWIFAFRSVIWQGGKLSGMGAFGTSEATKEPPEDVLLKHTCLPCSWFLLISGLGGFHFTSPALKYSSVHGKLHKQAALSSGLLLGYPLPTILFPSFLPHTKFILIIWCKDPRLEKKQRENPSSLSHRYLVEWLSSFIFMTFVLELFLFPTFSLSGSYPPTSGINILLF